MRGFIITLSACCLVFAFAGCSKSETDRSAAGPQPTNTPGPGQKSTNGIDACSLLSSQEIETILGVPVKDTKSSVNAQGGLTVSQCYFLLPVAADSIVLTVTQKADGPNSLDPKQSWEKMFDGDKDKPGEREGEESKSPPPEKIDALGDEAFWAPRRFGGTIYALKGSRSISISVGGAGDQATKLQKSKALAEIVLKRL